MRLTLAESPPHRGNSVVDTPNAGVNENLLVAYYGRVLPRPRYQESSVVTRSSGRKPRISNHSQDLGLLRNNPVVLFDRPLA